MSDSVSTRAQQPTRLLRPWDSLGKSTGEGCYCLLQCTKVKSETEIAQSCPTLSDPWTAAYQASPSMGFSRQEYWSRLPLPSLEHQTSLTVKDESTSAHHVVKCNVIKWGILYPPSSGFHLLAMSRFSLASTHIICGKKRIMSLETPTQVKEIQMLWQIRHTERWVKYTSVGFSYWWDLSEQAVTTVRR